MTERTEGLKQFQQRALGVVEETTRAYFATPSASYARMQGIIQVEDAQRFASFMGAPYAEVIKAFLRGSPEKFRQDYLDTIYDEGVLFGTDAEAIAKEFNLVSPTLGL